MLKFCSTFFILWLFIFNWNPKLQASCTSVINNSGGTTTVSNCIYDTKDPNTLKYDPKDGKLPVDFQFHISSVTGNISEIATQNTTGKSKHMVTIDSSKLSIGKLYNNTTSTGSPISGTLELRNNSEVTFTKEGLQTDIVKLTNSKLILDGSTAPSSGSINKISSLEMDEHSSLTLDHKAILTIQGGKEIKKNLDILNGSSMTIDYSNTDNNFKISTLNLNGENSTFKKSGKGTVVIDKSFFSADKNKDFKVEVDGGVLDVGSIGNQSDKSNNSFYIKSGKLKFNQGDFKANIEPGGEMYYSSTNSNASIRINSNKGATGTLTAEGKTLTLINTNLDTLNVKSGNVIINTMDEQNNLQNTNITNLNIEGGSLSSGSLDKNSAYFENISISKGGNFTYSTNNFSNLKSLKIFDKGEFLFLGDHSLTLDNVDASKDGIITLQVGIHNGALKLTNSKVAIINLTINSSINKGSSFLDISNSDHVGRLNLNFFNSANSIEINGSNIDEIEMQRRGSLNISKDANIKSIINSSSFDPIIKINGGNIDNIYLNNSGSVTINKEAKIKNISLLGGEKVNIDGGNITNLNITSKNKKAELIMNGGNINTFRLENIINKLELNETKITNYEIAIENTTFNFTQNNVENLILDGKQSIVNWGNGTSATPLKTIVLDQGTLNYNYNKDISINSITTTKNHPLYPKSDCKDDDKKCKDDNSKKPIYDTEFKINAHNATLSVGKIDIENLNLQSGYLEIKDSMNTQRKLTLGIDDINKDNLVNSKPKVHSNGDVNLNGDLEVQFNSTYYFLLGVNNKFELIQSDKAINKNDSKFKFLTNLSYWFNVDETLENGKNGGQSLLVSINRKYLYSQIVKQNGGGNGIYDVSTLLDSMITSTRDIPDYMKLIITGLDTQSPDGSALITNISKLMPVSSRIYSNSIHTNNYKIIDALSSELRDFTNLEDNMWIKMGYNNILMKDNKDVIGYTEGSDTMQIGYSKIINSKAILGGSISYLVGSLNGNHSNYIEDFKTVNSSLGIDYLFTPQYYGKAILSYSTTKFDNTRNLNFIKLSDNSNLNSQEMLAHFENGYITTLPQEFYNFNATYNVFYSIGSIAIDSYSEEGIGRLNVDGSNILVNDFGVGVTFDKEILYDKNDISLKPTIGLAMGVRYYSGGETKFNFQDIKDTINQFHISSGSYLPIFIKSKFGIDYIAPWANISVGYRFETDAIKHMDSSFYLSFKHSF